MALWPPHIPDTEDFVGAFAHLTENVRHGLHQEDLSVADKSLAQYMRTANVGAALVPLPIHWSESRMVVMFDTVTQRSIRSKMLRVFRASPEGPGIFMVPLRVTHAAVNCMDKKDVKVLADELVGGFYEQFDMAKGFGVSDVELSEIHPARFKKALHQIYDEIRDRVLPVFENK